MTTQDIVAIVSKVVAPIARRAKLTVAKAVINAVKDTSKLQTVQVTLLAGETKDRVERFQEYGFTSQPLAGCEGVFLAVGGSRDHGVIAGTDDRRYRPTSLGAGDVCLYTDAGPLVTIRSAGAGGGVELGPAPTDKVTLATPVGNRLTAIEQWLTRATAGGNPVQGGSGPHAGSAFVADTSVIAATKVKAI